MVYLNTSTEEEVEGEKEEKQPLTGLHIENVCKVVERPADRFNHFFRTCVQTIFVSFTRIFYERYQ